MACLGSVLYDPGTLATSSTASLLAMTAFDTTNARITFTAPSNGSVMVLLRVPWKGSTSHPSPLLGVLDGTTVRARMTPIQSATTGSSSTGLAVYEIVALVTGLTPGNSYTWDAAYGVQVVTASTQFGWGGPNDATGANAYGALRYEIWETTNLLAGTHYDPAVAVTKSTSAGAAMAAFDTTNLRLTFTAPSTGKVLVRLRCAGSGATTYSVVHLGVLDGATVKGRVPAFAFMNAGTTVGLVAFHGEFVVSGLTPSNSYTWDAAFGIELAVAASLAYGGPNDATGADAWGGFAYEIWQA